MSRLFGMVHVHALPGTPAAGGDDGAPFDIDEVVERAVADAQVYADAGFAGIIIENMHDVPYLRRTVGPEVVACMTAVGASVYEVLSDEMTLGVQVLAGANRAALAIAQATGAQFIRAEGFVFAAVADEGLLEEADAGPLLRYRKAMDADHISIWADIKKKHSAHAITGDVDLAETARAAVFCGADAVIVTGGATGMPVEMDDVRRAKEAVEDRAILAVGSGITPDNARRVLDAGADVLIVGSYCKRGGHWRNDVDPQRAAAIVSAM